MPQHKCEQCGIEVEKYSYGNYCKKCAQEVWDSGFDSTCEQAYQIGFEELVGQLKENPPEKQNQVIQEIISEWGALDWLCPECKSVRLNKEEAKESNKDQVYEKISTKCRCGSQKIALPQAPKKYYI